MRGVTALRELLAELPVSEELLAPLASVVNELEERVTVGAAALVQLQSLKEIIDARYFKRGEPCPMCTGPGKHTTSCYVPLSAGWDLLNEHEAIVRENNELRAALALHLPHNGKLIKAGRMSLKDRARNATPSE